MVNIQELITDYICKATNKMAEFSKLATNLLEKKGCKCDISEYTEKILDINSSLYILNKSFDQIELTYGYPNFVNYTYSEDPEDNIRAIISRYVIRYDMNDSSVLLYPGYASIITILPCCDCEGIGASLPPGGGPGYYLTKDGTGTVIWKRIENNIDERKFIYTSPDPQTFTLPSGATATAVYVRGIRVPKVTYWSQSGDDVTINDGWIIGNGSEVLIEFAYGDVSIISVEIIGNVMFREEYMLTSGNNVFNSSNPIKAFAFLTLNGVELDSVDYSFTPGDTEITMNDTLYGTNYVNIYYEKTI